jgi:hypothetical protein
MEYKQVVWKCDFCGRIQTVEPRRKKYCGWITVQIDHVGNTIHVCDRLVCIKAATTFCEKNIGRLEKLLSEMDAVLVASSGAG